MNYMKKVKPIFFSIVLLLTVCSTASAQRRHYGGGYRNYNYYGYNSYRPYHSYVSVNFGRPYNYYPYYNRPVYRTPYSYVHFGPAFGFRINVLPYGYYPFYFGGNPYYYYDGIYYRPYSGGGYEVAPPPIGATVKHLPSGAKVTVIDGVKYYELGGTFYQEEITENNKLRYRVVGTDGVLNTGAGTDEDSNYTTPPATQQNNTPAEELPAVGARFDKLPEGSKTVILKKEKYYVSPAGVYYQEVIDGNNIRYEVTGTGENGK